MENLISLDCRNITEEKVGEHGIKNEELTALSEMAMRAYEKLQNAKKTGEIGFLDLPYKIDRAKEIKNFINESLRYKYDNFLAIGIGGSILGNIALFQSLKSPYWNFLTKEKRQGYLRFFAADNVDPDLISSLINILDIKKTVINVISKAGTTTETIANFFIFLKILKNKIGKKYNKHIIITTDPEKGFLRELAKKENIKTFEIEEKVTGRYSTLSTVGLVSSAAVGIDIIRLLKGAQWVDKQFDTNEIFKNLPMLFAALQYIFYNKGKRIQVLMPYSSRLYGIADWFRQLWAESLGKKFTKDGKTVNLGPTPIKSLGVIDQHSQLQLYIEGPYDKTITFISVKKFDNTIKIPKYNQHYLSGHTLNELIEYERLGTVYSLTQEKRPNMTITISDISPESVGALLFFFELATFYFAEFLNVNAFDQPGVELGKNITYALMGRKGFEGFLPRENLYQRR